MSPHPFRPLPAQHPQQPSDAGRNKRKDENNVARGRAGHFGGAPQAGHTAAGETGVDLLGPLGQQRLQDVAAEQGTGERGPEHSGAERRLVQGSGGLPRGRRRLGAGGDEADSGQEELPVADAEESSEHAESAEAARQQKSKCQQAKR